MHDALQDDRLKPPRDYGKSTYGNLTLTWQGETVNIALRQADADIKTLGREIRNELVLELATAGGSKFLIAAIELAEAAHDARKMRQLVSTIDNVQDQLEVRKMLAELVELDGAPNSVVLGASNELAGLRNARNFVPGLRQISRDTCGLHCVGSIFDELLPARTATNLNATFGRTTSQILKARGGRGLSAVELAHLVGDNSDEVAALVKDRVGADALEAFLSRGSVISHVDGNHFVRPLRVFEDGGSKWVRIYDPARGYYDQLLDSFITRTGANNQMILIIGP